MSIAVSGTAGVCCRTAECGVPPRELVVAGRDPTEIEDTEARPVQSSRFVGRESLPVPTSSFIGREAELAAVRALVARSRLVTLTGTGGAGKTRLVLEAAAGLADGAGDGPWFADLAPLGDPELVTAAVADVLGVRSQPARPVMDTLVEAVGARLLLVVLDNCEHVIGACAKLADALLRRCPGISLLATSREPLGIDGEQVYRVLPLGLPAEDADAAAVRASEAVRLLEDRAAAQGVALVWNDVDAQVVARICRQLDGIPLAIELAAARLRVMPPGELEARLDERFAVLTGGSRAALPRQQTLLAMVDWSWDRLTGPERMVLARLSVFAEGFGLAAAEVVAVGQVLPAAEVLGVLGALVDKSLVQFGRSESDSDSRPGRYRLLETVRQYASMQLGALGPASADAVRIAHRDYYLAMAEEAVPHLKAADQAEWLDRLDAELGNLRSAVSFSLTRTDLEPGLRLATSLETYWYVRGYAAEGVGTLRALLDAQCECAQEATLLRARALAAAGRLLIAAGDNATAWVYCRQALTIAHTIGDEYLVAEVLRLQSWVLLRRGQPASGVPLAEAGLSLARRLEDRHLTARLLSARASCTHAEGDDASPARDVAEALRLFGRAGDRLQTGRMLGNLGYFELSAGDLAAARGHLGEALGISRALGDRFALVCQTFNLGLAEYVGGSTQAAGTLFTESLHAACCTGMGAQAAYALLGLALVGRGGTDPRWQARLHGATDQALADHGESLEPLEARLADRDRERLRAALGGAVFEAEYAVGRTLDAAQVLAVLRHESTAARHASTTGPGEAATMLTPRELDVLKLVAQGLSNAGIARRLALSEHTVHRHLANILRKLDLPSRAAAVAWGVRAGLV